MTLYDLTNTFFEGEAAAQPKAERGHCKEKRADCPLLTLGLVLDGSGFVRRSEVFAGALSEDTTLAPMLQALQAPSDALVVMDAGVATEANVAWLRQNGYRYRVVSRERTRRFDPELAVALKTCSRQERPCPQGLRRRRDATLLLLRGTGEQGKGYGRAIRHAFRGRAQETERRPVAAAHPQAAQTTSGSASVAIKG